MTDCTSTSTYFSPLNRRQIETQFSGGDMTSDAGVLLLRELDKHLCLSKQVASVFPDTRHSSYVKHSLQSLIRQRLYVFCGEQLLVSYLRPSNIDGAKHSWAILSLLVKRLRKQWPNVRIIIRGDSGFCRHQMMNWCERHDVGYVLGIAKNSPILEMLSPWIDAVNEQYERSGNPLRWFTHIQYAAQSWSRQRRVIAKIEHTGKGMNPRFVVTNLSGEHQAIYEDLYCARGEMENHIKEQQLDMFADRTSCHHWWPNQWRLLLSSLAYVLMERLRHHCLKSTVFAQLQVGTIRLKLLKVAAVILSNTRRIRLLLPSAYPYQDIFELVVARLKPG